VKELGRGDEHAAPFARRRDSGPYGQLPECVLPVGGVVVDGVVVVVGVVGVVVEDEPDAALAIAAPPPAMRPAAPSVTRAMRNRFKALFTSSRVVHRVVPVNAPRMSRV
jgi:hypothetical protein